MNTETLEEPQGYEQEFETIQIAHAQYGDIQFEAPIGVSDEEVKTEFDKLDLDLLLGLEQVNETEVGETQVEKLKEFENSAGAGRRDNKWYGHESLEGGTQTIAYGHKLTPEEAKSGFISINGELVDYRQGLSQDHAEAVLKADTQWAQTHASASLKKIGMEDDEGKLQAITSLIYNVGSGSWGSSKAKKFLEAGNIEDFMHEAFSEEAGFVNINGEYSRGLARRRKEEAGLFAQANINEGSPFSKMISEVLNTINPISTAQASDDPKGLPLPTQAEADAATAAAEPSSKFGTPPVKPEPEDMSPPKSMADFVGNLLVGTAEAAIPTKFGMPLKKIEPWKPSASEMLDVPEFGKAGILSFMGPDSGAMYTLSNSSFQESTMAALREAHRRSGDAKSVGYTDYPDTARGIPTRVFMHENLTTAERKIMDDTYGGFDGMMKMLVDIRTDPVIQAALSVGGFTKGTGEFDVDERWNFNSRNKTTSNSYNSLRNIVGMLLPTGDESQGPKVQLKLFNSEQ